MISVRVVLETQFNTTTYTDDVNTLVDIDNLILRDICRVMTNWRLTHDRYCCQ